MPLGKKQLRLAKHINTHVARIIARGGGDEELLQSMYDYMPAFKELLDISTKAQMDELCERYDGFYRFGKLAEMLAQGIADGHVEVPR